MRLFQCSMMDVLSAVRIAERTATREGFPNVAQRDRDIEAILETLMHNSGDDQLILTTKTQLTEWMSANV